MPRSSRSKTKPAHTMMPSSQRLDAIDNWLQKMLNAFPAKGTITPEEINDWHKDLANFSLEAIDFAFEKHRTNAIFFPLYGQIIDLCISYEPPEPPSTFTRIPSEEYGKGYGQADILWLWNRAFGRQRNRFPNGNPIINKPLVQARALGNLPSSVGLKRDAIYIEHEHKVVDWDALMDELDIVRGDSPAWRKR
jgi:hypothetical protein